MLAKLGNLYNNIERKLIMIALVAMLAVTFTNVVLRFGFNSGLIWSEEFVIFVFIWLSWLGVSVGLNDKAHLRVELLGKVLHKKGHFKTNECVSLSVWIIWLATTVIVAYNGLPVIDMQLRFGVVSPTMRLPMWIVYLAIPFCSTVVAIRLLLNIKNSILILLGKKAPPEEKPIEVPESEVND